MKRKAPQDETRTLDGIRQARRYQWIFFGALALALMLAALVRFHRLGDEDYWLDELHSLANSAGRRAEFESVPHGVIFSSYARSTDLAPTSTIGAAWRGMTADTHPPLYFVLLWGWRQLVGDGEFAIRSLSVIFSVLSILPFALIFLELGRPWCGVIGAFTLALSFSHVHMAQEARPYALSVLTLSLSFWTLVRLERRWDRIDVRGRAIGGAAYAIATYCTIMTHYFAGLALLGQIVIVLMSDSKRFRLAWLFFASCAMFAFVVSWGPQFYRQLDVIHGQDWLLEQRTHPPLRTLHRVAILPVRLLFTHEPFQMNIPLAVVGALILLGALVAVRRFRVRESGVFLAWFIVPYVGFAVMELWTQKRLLSHIRYPSFAAPGLVGLLVMATMPLRRSIRTGTVAGLLAVMALSLRLPTQDNPMNNQAANLLSDQLHDGDLLVFDAMGWPRFWTALIYHNIAFYLPRHLRTPMPPLLLLRDPPDDALKEAMSSYGRIVVVAPRVEAVPNPDPDRFRLVARTDYIHLVGFIHLFERNGAP